MSSILRSVVFFVAIGLVIQIAIALVLIASARPKGAANSGEGGLSFASVLGGLLPDAPEPETYPARDGARLPFRSWPSRPGAPLLILLHGSGWYGMQFHQLGRELAAAGAAHVVAPDLRGHGAHPARRGDVEYIGQLEDDVADLIAHLRANGHGGPVLIGGHSSGGGLAVRFAGGRHGALADGYLLLAPFLQHNAPTTRPNSGGWARPLTRRIIGLAMLNGLRITALNHLTAIEFAMPRSVLDGPLGHTATTAYSYRLNTSYAPRNWKKDLTALKQPLLVIAGGEDGAFFAERYEAAMKPLTPQAQFLIVPGRDHLGIVDAQETVEAAQSWLGSLRS